jgi:DNA-binding GntR family transcriptional regulator
MSPLRTEMLPTDTDDSAALAATMVYERLRRDIIEGRLAANERLKINMLAVRYGVSANPVREALQQLRGEGFVVMQPNRGARVRTIDENFFRDICEVEMLIEPHLAQAFVGMATDADIAEMERLQEQMEALNFADPIQHSALDTAFHRVMYDRNYNRHMIDMWWHHRQILQAVTQAVPMSVNRKLVALREHHELLAAIKAQDAEAVGEIMRRHVGGSYRHWVEQMQAVRRRDS